MIAYIGSSQEDLRNLYRAFRAGSECDPYLQPAEMNCTSHPHGFGYVIFDSKGGLRHYRTSKAVYEDQAPLPELAGGIHGILHSRLASDPSLSGPIFSHPFVASTEKEILFLAHNGGVDPGVLPERMVDSEWVLQQMVAAGGIEQALPLLKSRTRRHSALNLVIMAIPRAVGTTPAIYFVNYYDTDRPGKQDYYRMFSGDMPGGRAVFSSTFKDSGIKGLRQIAEVRFAEPQRL